MSFYYEVPNLPEVVAIEPPYVGIIGAVCGAETEERIVHKTPGGPLHRAVCGRWADHEGQHEQRDRRTFRVLHRWSDDECRARGHRELHRIEVARSRSSVRFEVTSEEGSHHE